jgi:hypothetical protein
MAAAAWGRDNCRHGVVESRVDRRSSNRGQARSAVGPAKSSRPGGTQNVRLRTPSTGWRRRTLRRRRAGNAAAPPANSITPCCATASASGIARKRMHTPRTSGTRPKVFGHCIRPPSKSLWSMSCTQRSLEAKAPPRIVPCWPSAALRDCGTRSDNAICHQ